MNKTDLQALTSVGPSITRAVLDPLAVLSLDNQLSIHKVSDTILQSLQLIDLEI